MVLGDPRMGDHTKVGATFSAEDIEAIERVKAALAELSGYRFTYYQDHTVLLSELIARPPAFVLNLCDTGYRNDPARELHIPALLELLDVPYSGCPPTALSLCYDKGAVRALAAAHHIPVPDEYYVDCDDPDPELPSTYPALIKPCRGDGSFGIPRHALVHDRGEARTRLAQLFEECPGRGALVQEFLSGAEYSLGLIGNPGDGFTLLPPLEVDYSRLAPELPRILPYESKTVATSPYWSQLGYVEAELTSDRREQLVESSKLLFARLGCNDYARCDFRADSDGELKLLEVNPNPAWCWDGKLNLMAEFAGLSYAQLLKTILGAAQRRCAAVATHRRV